MFEKKKRQPDVDELEDLFNDALNQDFNVQAEDGSVRWLARLIVQLHHDCIEKQVSRLSLVIFSTWHQLARKSQRLLNNAPYVLPGLHGA